MSAEGKRANELALSMLGLRVAMIRKGYRPLPTDESQGPEGLCTIVWVMGGQEWTASITAWDVLTLMRHTNRASEGIEIHLDAVRLDKPDQIVERILPSLMNIDIPVK
jgi:hypothetical protein|nr:MAG TPA: hypothetical protein [Caudoviricetes sp.]